MQRPNQGMVLLLVLVLLVASSLLLMGVYFLSTAQTQSARLYKESSLAFQSAERGIKIIKRRYLLDLAAENLPTCSSLLTDKFQWQEGQRRGVCDSDDPTMYLSAGQVGGRPVLDDLFLDQESRLAGQIFAKDWAESWAEADATLRRLPPPKFLIERLPASGSSGSSGGGSLDGSLTPDGGAGGGSLSSYWFRVTVRGFGVADQNDAASVSTLESVEAIQE